MKQKNTPSKESLMIGKFQSDLSVIEFAEYDNFNDAYIIFVIMLS